jgi:hypothetical protein
MTALFVYQPVAEGMSRLSDVSDTVRWGLLEMIMKARKDMAYILRRDESGWRAEAHTEQDLTLTPVGVGDRKEEAVENLKSQPQFQQLLQRYGRAQPELEDFTIDTAAEKEMVANMQRQYGYAQSGPQRTMEEPRSLEPRNIKPRHAKPTQPARAPKLPPGADRRKPPQSR